MSLRKNLRLLPALLSLLLLFSCASHPQIDPDLEAYLYPVETFLPEKIEWEEVAPGIGRLDFENPEFPLVYHAVRIELDTPGLEIVCFPSREFALSKAKSGTSTEASIPQPFIYRSRKTSAFSRQEDCLVAVNATPFGGRNGKWDFAAKIGSVRQLVGVHIDRSFMIARPVESYAALIFRASDEDASSYVAEIVDSQKADAFENCDYAFGGFFTVLRDGQVKDFSVRTHDSRSGAGISADGKVLYLLVVEGENARKSEGLSYPQCGEIFKALGCDDALEFDGGSSSQLFIKGKNVMNYSTIVVQGNSFGFKKAKR
ncbi:MAG: phosphodiester glycosidase family protein [Treponema sp.]|nr:phosphodiester glycosidase family protein [Treponema sp.]